MQIKSSPKNKTKIGLFITKGVWGGAQKYLYNIAVNLDKNKYDIFVVLGEGNILKDKLISRNIRTYEIKSLDRDLSITKEIKSFIELFKIIKKENPEIIHLNSPKASGLAGLAGKLLKTKKIIQTVHGWSFNEDRNIVSKLLIYIFSYITVIICHKTIVISKKEKDSGIKMPFINKNKFVLIKNGLEKINFIDKNIVREAIFERVKSRYSIEINKKNLWIGTVSELHKNKGLEYVIRSLKNINKDFYFFIIGEGEEKQKIENLIEKNNLNKKVFLLGFIDIANLYLKAFDIFTLTSIKEGLPYSVLEAGLAQLPVLASEVGGIPEIITDSKNGLLSKKKDVNEITKDLNFLIENKEKRNEYGKKLKEKIEREFSLDYMIKRTEELYKKVN